MQNKKVLVIGATGALGQYLVPELANCGYSVDAVALDKAESPFSNVRCIQANAKDPGVMDQLLENRYDGMVDFMWYPTASLMSDLPRYLSGAVGHYIYLSSYRIYDTGTLPIREESPRLIDSTADVRLRNSDDYSIYKARGENIVRTFPNENWTIIRPAVTYAKMRYQLVTLERDRTVGRAFAGKLVVLPEQARKVQATMSWAGDVAKMIAGLLFQDSARGETFTVSTAEHHSWEEIAEYYREICGLKAVWVDKEDYIRILNPTANQWTTRWQLEYDRMLDRVMDNRKILQTTGMQQKDMMPLYKGLEYEISRCPRDWRFRECPAMDEYLASHGF